MGNSGQNNSKGSIGCGCFLWFFAGIVFAITSFMFPKMPDYAKAMEKGEVVSGAVTKVEIVENITINGKHPKKVFYEYGDGKTASMTMAMGESAKKGKNLRIRVLGDSAYPEGIRPFIRPKWLTPVLIGLVAVGGIFVVIAILKWVLIGGLLFAAGRKLKDNQPPTPPSTPPPLD